MRDLTFSELNEVSGGDAYERNFSDSVMVSMVFATLCSSTMGVMSGTFWYLQFADTSAKALALAASTSALPVVSLPVAVFAGLGFGGCVGLAAGMFLYWSGVVTKPNNP
jgi:hypothetical protein